MDTMNDSINNTHSHANDSVSDIDFVIIWVDGSDPKWQTEKMRYSGAEASKSDVDEATHRYRDWNNLQYLFRGIERFTPWVRKVHFVTSGHVPSWLNLDSEKLHFVKHEDYIPAEYLPTFSANPIELNLHRIEGLAEKFVFFNDDTFITKPMKETDFFVNDLPCDKAILNRIVSTDHRDIFPHIILNDIGALNKNFVKNDAIRKYRSKWFSPRYGVVPLIRSLLLMPYSNFSGLSWAHLPSSFLKSTFLEVWKKEPELLRNTSLHKFRHIQDVNQYLIRGWQVVSGSFSPKNTEKGSKAFFNPSKQKEELYASIRKQKYSMICINDAEACDNFEQVRDGVIKSFDAVLPDKSTFENKPYEV